jgi:tetratricopeptide (TPR) repeat protein
MRFNIGRIQNIIIVILGIVIICLLVIFVPRSDKYIRYQLDKTKPLIIQKKFAEAEQIFQKVLKHNPDCGPAFRGIGICYAMNEDFDQAMYYYQRAVDVGDAEGLGMLAMLYILTDHEEKIGELIPGLLEFKMENTRNLRYILTYAITTNDQKLFENALQGVSQEYIESDEVVSELVIKGKRYFRCRLIDSL